uniref:RACK1C n=1 Tax=Catalpa bungei TaxID=265496 RepID=A0A142CD05_9LAMI|nr:RACK1C [Catalpa bungei]
MATQFLNYTENPLNFQKFKKNPKNSNLKSFWAFLLSILIYISVFYFFNLSLSTLFCTTEFWFIISNTLILIIATDFGAFSSSKDHDFYDDYGKLNNSLRIINPKHRTTEEVDEEPGEKIIEMVVADDDRSKNQETVENNKTEIPENNEEDDQSENPNEKIEENEREIISSLNSEVENGAHEVKKIKVQCARSNSDKAILTAAAAEKEEKMVLRRTLSERQEEPRSEENEFSRMSDEELNRRVEEFIRRCNRQIRLQAAAKNRQNWEI